MEAGQHSAVNAVLPLTPQSGLEIEMPSRIIKPGDRFGRFVVVSFSHRNKHKVKHWLLRCDCGNTRIVQQGQFTTGIVQSCGCLRNERVAAAHTLPRADVESLPEIVGARYIPLTQGKVAIVDETDFSSLSEFSWFANFNPRNGFWYAVRNERVNGKQRKIFMHKVVAGAIGREQADHQNGDTLDNRRSNVRRCTGLQNAKNRKITVGTASGYKGVYPSGKRFRAIIQSDHVSHDLGVFATAEAAARAYDEAAKKYHGEFARLNFPC